MSVLEGTCSTTANTADLTFSRSTEHGAITEFKIGGPNAVKEIWAPIATPLPTTRRTDGARDYDPNLGRWLTKDPILFGGRQTNLYVYVSNDPISFIDPSGLYTEVIIWEPVGYLSSSFGHISIVVDGTSYSWGPGKMDIQPAASYIARNSAFRSGRGFILGLDPQQEHALKASLRSHSGDYKALTNNCTDPIEQGLVAVGARNASLNALLPTGVARSLGDLAIGQTAYLGPESSAFLPWSNAIGSSFRSMY